jgi:hypothetical protein
VLRIEGGINNWLATVSTLCVPFWLALKAEAFYLADRTFEALEALREAEVMAKKFEERWWCAELHRLRGVFLRRLVLTRPKLRLRSSKQSSPQSSRSRFR